MDNDIIPFNYKHHEVRTVMIEGEPWFVAADVCRVLELVNTTNALRVVPPHHVALQQIKGKVKTTRSNVISETGLYLLISRSDKPEARAFMLWVCEEVLPQIRKTVAKLDDDEKGGTQYALPWWNPTSFCDK